MNQRERLIELIKQIVHPYFAKEIADLLLEKGVLVPPCRIGDDIFWACDSEDAKIFDDDPGVGVYKDTGGIKVITWDGNRFGVLVDGDVIPFGDQYACLTREEAEKYLPEGGKDA